MSLLVLVLIVASSFLVALTPITQSTLLVAGIAGLLFSLRSPWLVWLGLALVLPVAASIRAGGIAPTDLLIAAAIYIWSSHAIAQRSWVASASAIVWPALLYIGVLLISSLGARDLVEAIAEVIKWIEFAVVLWIVPNVVPHNRAKWLVVALLLAAAAQAGYGLYQFFYQVGPEWFSIQGRFMRASGSFRQPNPYAGYLGLTLPIAFSLLLWAFYQWRSRPATAKTTGILLLSAATAGLIGAGLVASWSRGGWLGATVAAAVVLALSSRGGALLLLATGFTALPALLLGMLSPTWIPGPLRARIADIPMFFGAGDLLAQTVTDANFAVVERLAHWSAALRMWESAPWLGIGPGNYNAAYPTFALPQWPEPLGHAHNVYLNVLAESGMIGLDAFLVLWAVLIVWTVRRMTDAHAYSWQRALAIGTLGVYAHLAIHSLFDNLFVQGNYLHLAFWPAILATVLPRESEN